MASRFPRWIAVALTAAVVATTLTIGAHAVGGADSQGYASQAELWLAGSPVVAMPELITDPPPFARQAFAPLGWRLTDNQDARVPVYAPGYPLLMAAARMIAGHTAIFVITPLMAGLLIWCTYLLGRRVAGDWVGVGAAALVATSPTVMFQAMMPMSDVPSAALWSCTLLLTLSRSPRTAALAGMVAGMAILVRPNLAPLLVICVAWRAWRDRPDWRATALMATTAAPAIVVLALLNQSWYGGPLRSGYGDLSYYYDWTHVWPNVLNYTRWWTTAEGPLVALALVGGVWLLRTRRLPPSSSAALYAMAVVFVAATYVPYAVFEVWTYLRFWLPIVPALAVLAACGARAFVAWKPSMRWPVGLALAAVVLAVNVTFARDHGIFRVGLIESRYPQVATLTSQFTKAGDIIVAMQHSGTLPYYADRNTVQWDIIEPHLFDGALDWLQARHGDVWLLLDQFEVDAIRARSSGGHSAYGALDWAPAASFFHGETQLFRLSDRNKPGRYPARLGDYTRRPVPSARSVR